MKLANQVAIVTGGASGIGRAIVARFQSEGAQVAVADVQPAGGALFVPTDVSDPAAVDRLFTEVAEKLGPVDILVNNAGIGGGPSPTAYLKDEDWARMLAVHLNGTFYCTRAALRVMQPRRRGHIINIASVAGLRGLPFGTSYSAAKAGILGLTRAVAQEVIADGIFVNAIAPGWVDTPILKNLPPDRLAMATALIPQGRIAQPDEIARVAVFLASDDSSYMVGQTVSPNGGIWF